MTLGEVKEHRKIMTIMIRSFEPFACFIMSRFEHSIHVPTEIRRLMIEAKNEVSFEQALFLLNRQHKVPMSFLRMHALHQACSKDDARLVEFLLKNVAEKSRISLVNSPLGTHSYTPLFRAAYAGSIRMVKFLIMIGARSDFRNCHGEDVQSCIDAGFQNLRIDMPENAIFLKERFDECAKFLQEHQQRVEQESDTKHDVIQTSPYIPRSVLRSRAVTTISRYWRLRRRHRSTLDDAPADGNGSDATGNDIAEERAFQIICRKRGRKRI